MKTFRIIADRSMLYEIHIEAENSDEAVKQAKHFAVEDFEKFDPFSDDDFTIIESSCEEVKNDY